MSKIRVTIWNEFMHERENPHVAKIYPCGIHHLLADALGKNTELEIRTATLAQPEHGLTEQICISWFEGGEVMRGGACWTRGSGRIFYFSPGHELYPIYHHPQIQRVIYNAIRWARPQGSPVGVPRHVPTAEAREKITSKGPQ